MRYGHFCAVICSTVLVLGSAGTANAFEVKKPKVHEI
jgi:hypothetical protein